MEGLLLYRCKELFVGKTFEFCKLMIHFCFPRDVVEVLLRNDALTNVADCKGCYPLHLAAWKGDAQIVRLLIHQGPSHTKVNEQVGRKGSFLPCSCSQTAAQISGKQLLEQAFPLPSTPPSSVREPSHHRRHLLCVFVSCTSGRVL